MRSKTGQLIENVAGYQNGNTILLIEVQKKLPHFNDALRVESVDRLV